MGIPPSPFDLPMSTRRRRPADRPSASGRARGRVVSSSATSSAPPTGATRSPGYGFPSGAVRPRVRRERHRSAAGRHGPDGRQTPRTRPGEAPGPAGFRRSRLLGGGARGRRRRVPGAAQGRGRRVEARHAPRGSADTASAFDVARALAADGSLYGALEGARHVEVQILADGLGGVLVCDRSVPSSRHQKLVEEAPALNLPTPRGPHDEAACGPPRLGLQECGHHGVPRRFDETLLPRAERRLRSSTWSPNSSPDSTSSPSSFAGPGRSSR